MKAESLCNCRTGMSTLNSSECHQLNGNSVAGLRSAAASLLHRYGTHRLAASATPRITEVEQHEQHDNANRERDGREHPVCRARVHVRVVPRRHNSGVVLGVEQTDRPNHQAEQHQRDNDNAGEE